MNNSEIKLESSCHFKEDSGQRFNRRLEQLDVEKPDQVIIAQVKDIISQVAVYESVEKEAESGITHIEEYNKEADLIDQKRKDIITGSIDKAVETSGVKKALDKILKDYPSYYKEKDEEDPS